MLAAYLSVGKLYTTIDITEWLIDITEWLEYLVLLLDGRCPVGRELKALTYLL